MTFQHGLMMIFRIVLLTCCPRKGRRTGKERQKKKNPNRRSLRSPRRRKLLNLAHIQNLLKKVLQINHLLAIVIQSTTYLLSDYPTISHFIHFSSHTIYTNSNTYSFLTHTNNNTTNRFHS